MTKQTQKPGFKHIAIKIKFLLNCESELLTRQSFASPWQVLSIGLLLGIFVASCCTAVHCAFAAHDPCVLLNRLVVQYGRLWVEEDSSREDRTRQ